MPSTSGGSSLGSRGPVPSIVPAGLTSAASIGRPIGRLMGCAGVTATSNRPGCLARSYSCMSAPPPSSRLPALPLPMESASARQSHPGSGRELPTGDITAEYISVELLARLPMPSPGIETELIVEDC